MYIELKGGLTSRLDVLASILISQSRKDIQLVWNPAPGVNCRFDDLFINDFNIISDIDTSQFNVREYQAGTTVNMGDDQYLIADWCIAFPDTYTDYDFVNAALMAKYTEVYHSLRPVPEIAKVVSDYAGGFQDRTYGVAIRRGTGINYHLHSCIFSPIERFINILKDMALRNDGSQVFISTDSYYDLERLCMAIDNLIYVKEYLTYPLDDGYTLPGMKRTLIDWLLLTKTKSLLVSYQNGFAYRVNRYFKVPIEVVEFSDSSVIDYYAQKINKIAKGNF